MAEPNLSSMIPNDHHDDQDMQDIEYDDDDSAWSDTDSCIDGSSFDYMEDCSSIETSSPPREEGERQVQTTESHGRQSSIGVDAEHGNIEQGEMERILVGETTQLSDTCSRLSFGQGHDLTVKRYLHYNPEGIVWFISIPSRDLSQDPSQDPSPDPDGSGTYLKVALAAMFEPDRSSEQRGPQDEADDSQEEVDSGKWSTRIANKWMSDSSPQEVTMGYELVSKLQNELRDRTTSREDDRGTLCEAESRLAFNALLFDYLVTRLGASNRGWNVSCRSGEGDEVQGLVGSYASVLVQDSCEICKSLAR